jgi:hypothetical protein
VFPFPGEPAFPGQGTFPGTGSLPENSAFPESSAFPAGGGPTGPLPGRVRQYGAAGGGAAGDDAAGDDAAGDDAAGGGPQRTAGPGPQRMPAPGSGLPSATGAGTGPSRVLGPGTGPQRLIGSSTGVHPVFPPGTGAQPAFPPGTGARPAFPPGTGAQPAFSPGPGAPSAVAPGTGVHRTLGPGTGPRPLAGSDPLDPLSPSGPHPVLSSAGSGERTPADGFPAAGDPATDPFSAWHAPREPLADPAAADTADVYQGDETVIFDPRAEGRGPRASAPSQERRRGARTGRRFQPRIAWIAAAVVIAAGAGFGGYKYLYEARVNAPVPSTLRLPTTAPDDNGLDKTLGKWQHIGSRSQDPQQLTIAPLFPPQFELKGKSYTRTAASVTKTCSLAVYGADLQAALQTGHCSQVVRASYISGDGTMMGTVGVVNLISSSAAAKAGKATGAQEIIAPLTSKKGPTSKLGNGAGVVQAEIKGHYLILMYAEYASLKSPSGTAQRQALQQFAANLLIGTANINLSTRMLTGKP